MAQPPMNADKRRLKTKNLSAFICVYPRPICLFQQPAKEREPGQRRNRWAGPAALADTGACRRRSAQLRTDIALSALILAAPGQFLPAE
jgi:hypothetical protein